MFIPNPKFEELWHQTKDSIEVRKQAAERAAALSRSLAPVGEEGEPEHYRDTIKVVAQPEGGLTRGGVILKSTHYFAHGIEWGSANNPPYAPLRRGVQAAGLRLDE